MAKTKENNVNPFTGEELQEDNKNLPVEYDADNNAITIDDEQVFAFLNGEVDNGFFTSLTADNEEAKAMLFNAATTTDNRLKSFVGKIIEVTDVVCQVVTVKNDDGRPPTQAPRIVFIGKDGVSYGCVSIGMVSCLQRLTGIYGKPTWSPPLRVEPCIIQGRGANNILSLKIHPRKS